MSKRYKVTVFLLPHEEDDGFTAVMPQFPDATTSGPTREAALASAKEALELALMDFHEDQEWWLELSHTPNAEIGEIEVEEPAKHAVTVQDDR